MADGSLRTMRDARLNTIGEGSNDVLRAFIGLVGMRDVGMKFKEAADRFQAEVTKLATVSKSGDEASVKSQIAAVGKQCSGCHENFREKR